MGTITIALGTCIAGVLFWAYAVAYEASLGNRPPSLLYRAYALATGALLLLTLGTAVIVARKLSSRPLRAASVAGMCVLSVCVFYTILAVLTLRVEWVPYLLAVTNAELFAEYKLLSFVFFVTPVCTVGAAFGAWVYAKSMDSTQCSR